MPKYAQIDEAGHCIGMAELHSEVIDPKLIPVDDDVDRMGQVWDGEAWTPPPPLPRIVITNVDAGDGARVAANFSEVDTPVGNTLHITAELRGPIDDSVLPVSDSFRMPVTSTDGREKVTLADMKDGAITLRIPMSESRTWCVTQETINRSLPREKHMAFAGLTVYVIEK